ncbi:MAG: hypothetical protein KDI04_10035, partial [Halieaceae bacterium]|nr:hypothetical protein [Halieaceae bacterium]
KYGGTLLDIAGDDIQALQVAQHAADLTRVGAARQALPQVLLRETAAAAQLGDDALDTASASNRPLLGI